MVALLKLLVRYNLVEGLTGLENAQAAETEEITPVRPTRPPATRRSPLRPACCIRRIARRPAAPLRYPFEAPERHRLHPMQRRVRDPSSWRPTRRRIRL